MFRDSSIALKGTHNFLIEIASIMAVKLINQACFQLSSLIYSISKIISHLSKFPVANVLHISRDANVAAELVAKDGFNCNNVNVVDLPPSY